jgi:hypothetical protein
MSPSSRHAAGDIEKAPPPDGVTRLAQAIATILCAATVFGILGAALAWMDILLAGSQGILWIPEVGLLAEVALVAVVGFLTAAVLGTAWVIGRRLLKWAATAPGETPRRRSA